MGANLLIVASSLFLPLSQHDKTDQAEQPTRGIAYERLSDAMAYDRVQGLSLGLGYRLPLQRSTAIYATVRYGLSDDRITGRLSIQRQLRSGAARLSGYSDVTSVDPFSPGRTISNTLNALLAGHDNADYVLARGVSVDWETRPAPALVLELEAKVDRQSSTGRVARSAVNDFLGGSGLFPANPPIREGTFTTASASLRRPGRNRWAVTLDAMGGEDVTVVRVFGVVRRSIGSSPGLAVQLKAGSSTEPGLPQMAFRLGGTNTVRGFDYGIRRAPAFWAAQADLTLFSGRVRPVLFVDAGQAGRTRDLFSSEALIGGGVGLALLRGLVRFDLSHPVSPDTRSKLRLDLVVQGGW